MVEAIFFSSFRAGMIIPNFMRMINIYCNDNTQSRFFLTDYLLESGFTMFITMGKGKVLINVALTGMVPTKEITSFVPITPEEIVQDAVRCAKAGANIVHIHARDGEGRPTWKKEVYEKIIAGIREKDTEIIITVSTTGRNWSEFEKRSEVLEIKGDLKPDMATLTMGSLNFINTASMNSPEMIERLANKMQGNGIKPEFEIFEPGMIHKANFLLERKMINDLKPYFNIFFGNLGTAPLDSANVASMLALVPKDGHWAFAGLGRYQLDANILALGLGGSIRTGIEDNMFLDQEKKVLASNLGLVERVRRIMSEMNLDTYSNKEARALIGL